MMLYLRAARRREDRQLGRLAVVTHGAVAEAIANTFGGKATPEFSGMVERLIGAEISGQQSGVPNAATLNRMTPSADGPAPFADNAGSLDGFKTF
jgi:hypothetical protein